VGSPPWVPRPLWFSLVLDRGLVPFGASRVKYAAVLKPDRSSMVSGIAHYRKRPFYTPCRPGHPREIMDFHVFSKDGVPKPFKTKGFRLEIRREASGGDSPGTLLGAPSGHPRGHWRSVPLGARWVSPGGSLGEFPREAVWGYPLGGVDGWVPRPGFPDPFGFR
jgi:hypothetical protein